MRWIYFLIALWFVGCSSHPGNNITDMDNHIIFAYKKPKTISFYDKNKINYPKVRKNRGDLGFGDGILFYSLNTDQETWVSTCTNWYYKRVYLWV